MTKEQAFIYAHDRNIEKLKGNRTAYYSYINDVNWSSRGSKYGINASRLLKISFEGSEVNITIKSYKLHGFLLGFIYGFLGILINLCVFYTFIFFLDDINKFEIETEI